MVDNTQGLLRACALNKALHASLCSFVASKVHNLSVIKQSNSKYFREVPILPFCLTRCNFVMMTLEILGV